MLGEIVPSMPDTLIGLLKERKKRKIKVLWQYKKLMSSAIRLTKKRNDGVSVLFGFECINKETETLNPNHYF